MFGKPRIFDGSFTRTIEPHRRRLPFAQGDPRRFLLRLRLESVVQGASEVELSLVARRDNILEGLCAQMGVDEETGQQ